MLPHSAVATRLVEEKIEYDKIDFEKFETQYNQQSTNLAKLILILLVVYLSVPLFLINYSRKMFYYDHLLVALETCSLIVLVNFVLLLWLLKLIVAGFALAGRDVGLILQDTYTMWISLAILFYLFYRIERAAYLQSWWKALGKSAVLLFSFYWVLQFYRGSLFFITFWTV
jgi:hypothetical protein